ncbi:MAG: hypothetical protein V3S37_06555 [Dehalococcoidia bacterium]
MTAQEKNYDRKYGVAEEVKGRYAECDGGASYPVVLPNGEWGMMPSRETFKGVLTGLYFDQGDPPWRWYEMVILHDRPAEYQEETVWCEPGFLFLEGEEQAGPEAWKKLMP